MTLRPFMTHQPIDPHVTYRQADRDYRKAEGISQSMLKEILVSPAHYQARYGPGAEPFFPSAAMIQGTATHCLILEPEEFDRQFYNRADKPKELTITQLKAELDEQGIEYPKSAKKADLELLVYPDGKPVEKRTSLDEATFSQVHSAAEALRSHEITGRWFDPSSPQYRKFNEVSLYARHDLGVNIKGRLDRMVVDNEDQVVNIYDLKTTASADPREFTRTLVNLKYDLQAAFYTRLVQQCFPEHAVNFYFVALERKAPHGISVFRAGADVLQAGTRKMEKALMKLISCQELDYWPGYDPVIHEVVMPAWAMGNDTESDF